MSAESDSPYENKNSDKRLSEIHISLKICDNCNYHKSNTPEYIHDRVISNLDGKKEQENVGDEENKED